MSRYYNAGATEALLHLGLTKQAVLGFGEDEHPIRNAAIAAAGASPFLGLIGQRRLRNSPYHGAKAPVMNIHDLQMQAQPGDVILTREGKNTPFRFFHELTTGSPLQHVEPVIGKHDVYFGTTADVAEHATPQGHLESVSEQRNRAKTVGQRAFDKNYKDVVLLRPNIPVDIDEFANRAVLESRKPYSFRRAATSTLKDIFFPKIPWVTDRPAGCTAHTCSSMTGEALRAATGKEVPVVEGKAVQELLPADFLRSKNFDIVGQTLENPRLAREIGRRAVRRSLALRAGLGLGLAGTAYGLSEDPDLAATAVGATAAPLIARRIAGKGAEGARKIRPFSTLLNVLHEKSPKAVAIKRNILTRTLPLALGGGLLSYLGTKQLHKKVTES